MIVYRICLQKFATLNGRGAEMYGGRWNNKGRPVVYAASSVSLAMVEVLVHLPSHLIPSDYVLMKIEVPESSIKEFTVQELSTEWNLLPGANETQKLGDNWLMENKKLLLKVPSAVVVQEHNILINPLHKLFHKVQVKDIKPYNFDSRLLKFKFDA